MGGKRLGDMTGMRFGKWTVASTAGRDAQGRAKLLCVCDCGTQKVLDSYSLRRGDTKSCGICYEPTFNQYCRNADGTATIYCENEKSFIVDYSDISLISHYKWHVNNRGYVISGSARPNLRLHRFLFGLTDSDKEIVVDHISGETTDNTRKNLRLCQTHLNARNRGLSKRSSTGYKGVSYWCRKGKYVAEIVFRDEFNTRHRKIVGRFDCPEEAARAYDRAALLYHGEFAKTNEMLGLLEVANAYSETA